MEIYGNIFVHLKSNNVGFRVARGCPKNKQQYVFSENVLGTEGYTIRKAYYNYTTKEWFDGNEEMEWTGITHWMPLPEEPYKAESKEEK